MDEETGNHVNNYFAGSSDNEVMRAIIEAYSYRPLMVADDEAEDETTLSGE